MVDTPILAASCDLPGVHHPHRSRNPRSNSPIASYTVSLHWIKHSTLYYAHVR